MNAPRHIVTVHNKETTHVKVEVRLTAPSSTKNKEHSNCIVEVEVSPTALIPNGQARHQSANNQPYTVDVKKSGTPGASVYVTLNNKIVYPQIKLEDTDTETTLSEKDTKNVQTNTNPIISDEKEVTVSRKKYEAYV